MKKRIRKKKHVGEFVHYGVVVRIAVNKGNAQNVFDKVVDIAERNGLIVWGGGYGLMSLPHVAKNYVLPNLVEVLMLNVLNGGNEDEMIFCAYSLKERTTKHAFSNEIKNEFVATEYNLVLNETVNLWAR